MLSTVGVVAGIALQRLAPDCATAALWSPPWAPTTSMLVYDGPGWTSVMLINASSRFSDVREVESLPRWSHTQSLLMRYTASDSHRVNWELIDEQAFGWPCRVIRAYRVISRGQVVVQSGFEGAGAIQSSLLPRIPIVLGMIVNVAIGSVAWAVVACMCFWSRSRWRRYCGKCGRCGYRMMHSTRPSVCPECGDRHRGSV